MADVPRDQWGRYKLPDPETGEVRSWPRVTGLVKLASSTYNLDKWRSRMVATGVASSDSIRAQVVSLDPNEDRGALNALVEEALTVARANEGAGLGTALHRFTERLDRGEQVQIPEQWEPDIVAYLDTMRDSGLTVEPRYLERVVVVPELGIAGTFDRIVTVHGKAYIADLKTGQSLAYNAPEVAIQLACYAHGSHLWDEAGYSPMPAVDRTKGLAIWLPAGRGVCELHWLDLEKGWEGALLCSAVDKWQKETRSNKGEWPTVVLAEPPDDGDVLRQNCLERIEAIREAGKLSVLAAAWPMGIPTFKELGNERHTPEQLATVDAAIGVAESTLGMEFHPATSVLGKDASLPTEQRRLLNDRYVALPRDLRQYVAAEVAVQGARLPGHSGATVEDGELLVLLLEEAEIEHESYRERAGAALQPLSVREAEAVLATVKRREGEPVSLVQCEDVERLSWALREKLVAVTQEDSDAPVRLMAVAGAVERLGGARDARAAVSAVCKERGWTLPRSAADAAGNVLALAYALTPHMEAT